MAAQNPENLEPIRNVVDRMIREFQEMMDDWVRRDLEALRAEQRSRQSGDRNRADGRPSPADEKPSGDRPADPPAPKPVASAKVDPTGPQVCPVCKSDDCFAIGSGEREGDTAVRWVCQDCDTWWWESSPSLTNQSPREPYAVCPRCEATGGTLAHLPIPSGRRRGGTFRYLCRACDKWWWDERPNRDPDYPFANSGEPT